MSAEYDKLVASVNAMEGLTPEQKAAILDPAKALNVERATAGQDIIKIKSELDGSKKDVASYKDFTATLAKLGIDAKNSDELAKQVGITKTHDDEKAQLKNILLESQTEAKELKAQLHKFKQEQTFAPAVVEAVKNFTDSEGKPITLMPDYVEKAKELALKGIKEGDDEVIVADRISKALTQSLADQNSMLERNGLTEANKGIHKVVVKPPTGSGTGSVLSESVQAAQKVMEVGHGSTDSGAQAIAIMEAEAAKNK